MSDRNIEAGVWGLAGVPKADHLFRVLRLAVRYGFVTGGVDTASGKVVFWNNALTSALREDHPNSVRYDCTLLLTWSCSHDVLNFVQISSNFTRVQRAKSSQCLNMNTSAGRSAALLTSDSKRILDCRALACHHMEDCYGPWSKLLPGLLTDKVPAHLWLREVTGKDMDVWQYLAENPAREEQFSRAMTSVDNLVRALCQSCVPARATMRRSRNDSNGGIGTHRSLAVIEAHIEMPFLMNTATLNQPKTAHLAGQSGASC